MDWVSVVTLLISGGTLVLLIIQFFVNNNNRNIDRRIGVMVNAQREKQKELFVHVLGLLDIERQITYATISESEMNKSFHNALDHKINIWINLNRNNKYAIDMRENCTLLAFWLASSLESSKDKESYMESAQRNAQIIWQLIDRYISEEEKLIEEMMSTKKHRIKPRGN